MATTNERPKELVEEIEEMVKKLEQTRGAGSEILKRAKAASQRAEEQVKKLPLTNLDGAEGGTHIA